MLLSLCMVGRDDDYTHDFIYRITTTLNHTARSITNLGQTDNIEILITDWGSKTPMSKTLKLSAEASKVCKFIYVPPELIRATQNGEEYFHTVRAINVAIRRANGRFILLANCDQLFQQHSLDMMLRLLDGSLRVLIDINRTLLMLPRIQVPWTFLEHQPGMDEWDRYMLLNEYALARAQIPIQNQFGGSGGLLLHRDLYYQLGGFDEINSGWGWNDAEFGFRTSQICPHLWLSNIGVFVFDMGHKPIGGRQLTILTKQNLLIFKPVIEVNENSWGLANYVLEEHQSQSGLSTSTTSKKQQQTEHLTIKNQILQPEILEQLQSLNILKHLLNNVFVFVRYNQRIVHNDINTLFLIAWYSINNFPRRYLEFGVLNGCSSGVVVSACPSAEVYLVDRWEGQPKEISLQGRGEPLLLTRMLYDAGLRGYLQFINGEIDTAVERLKTSFVGPFEFDLALVRGEIFDNIPAPQIIELISFISPGGALILTCESESNFNSIWNEIQQQFPGFSYFRCTNKKTGMVLAVSSDESYLNKGTCHEIKFAEQWFTRLLIRNNRERQFQRMRPIYYRIREAVRNLLT